MTKNSKPTKKQFEYFQERAEYWRHRLGLINWGVYYKHDKTDQSYASVNWSMQDALATVTLTADGWDEWRPLNDVELDKVALHEMLHLMLAIYCSVAEARYTTQSEIDIAEHSIIRQLEEVILGDSGAKV